MDIETLYEKYNILSEAKDRAQEYSNEFLECLQGVKSGEKEKKLSAQIIAKFFKHFPALQTQALNCVLDLCEDDDSTVRVCAMKTLPLIGKEAPTLMPKIIYILAQLLPLDGQEFLTAFTILKSIYISDPQEVIRGVGYYIRSCDKLEMRLKCLDFMLKHLKIMQVSNRKDVEDLLINEFLKIMRQGNPEEFIEIMPFLINSKVGKNPTSALQLIDIVAEQLDLDQPLDPVDSLKGNMNKIITCMKYLLSLFSEKQESTKFVIYLCNQVLPHWEAIGKLDNEGDIQYQVLMLLANLSTNCGKLENPSLQIVNVFDKLKIYLPLPPESKEIVNIPEFDFSNAECLLYTFHRLARQSPDFLTHDPEVLKEFRSRLMFFSRGVQASRQALDQRNKKKPLNQVEQEKFKTAPAMLDNINALIKDLFHTPPIYKCNVKLSFQDLDKIKEEEVPEKEVVKTKRHTPITFDGDKQTPNKQPKLGRTGENVKLYTPPSGKFSNNFQSYDRSNIRGRGRGFRSRGRSYNRGWRN